MDQKTLRRRAAVEQLVNSKFQDCKLRNPHNFIENDVKKYAEQLHLHDSLILLSSEVCNSIASSEHLFSFRYRGREGKRAVNAPLVIHVSSFVNLLLFLASIIVYETCKLRTFTGK